MSVDVFHLPTQDIEGWEAWRLAEYEAYFHLKAERQKERDAQREQQNTGGGQGPRATGRSTRTRRR